VLVCILAAFFSSQRKSPPEFFLLDMSCSLLAFILEAQKPFTQSPFSQSLAQLASRFLKLLRAPFSGDSLSVFKMIDYSFFSQAFETLAFLRFTESLLHLGLHGVFFVRALFLSESFFLHSPLSQCSGLFA